MSRLLLRLSSEDLQLVHDLASKRNKKESRFGARTYGNKRGGKETHLIGLAAEVAIARLFHLEVDNKIYNNRGDKGVDLVVPNVGNIAIKSTTYGDKPFLRAEVHHHHSEIDYYVACYVNPDDIGEVWFLGWATSETIIKAKQRKFMRFGPLNYVLTEEELNDLQELIDEYNRKNTQIVEQHDRRTTR